MSAAAERWNPESGNWDLVYAEHLGNDDRKYQYRCVCCHAPTTLAIYSSQNNRFCSRAHVLGCPVSKRRRILRITAHTEIDYDAILDYEDRDPPREPTPPPGGANGGGPVPRNPDDPGEDLALDPDATRTICSASGMYRELIEKHVSEYIDSFSAEEVASIFLRRDTLHRFKKDWGSPAKLVVTKRCVPNKLNPPISPPAGYFILRDAYSDKNEKAIYFMVKMRHPEHNRRFKERLLGHTEINENGVKTTVGKDPHRNIVIFARWAKVPHSHYQIYRAELNSRSYAFVNAPDAT